MNCENCVALVGDYVDITALMNCENCENLSRWTTWGLFLPHTLMQKKIKGLTNSKYFSCDAPRHDAHGKLIFSTVQLRFTWEPVRNW